MGASQLYHLVDQLINNDIVEHFEILVFEKSLNVGHGVAYAHDDDTNLLNRSAGTMSLIHKKPDDFINWLVKNRGKWKNSFADLKINKLKEAFLPRSLFGMYIEDTIQQTILRARKHKLKISIIHDEVIAIQKEIDEYQVGTNNGWLFYSEIVILTMGNLPSNKFGSYAGNDKFFTTPYPTKKLKLIPLNATVGIMGSRLSAVDAAIALSNNGHQGAIVFIARNGYLPAIRAPYRNHELQILIRHYLQNHSNDLSLHRLIKILTKEVGLAYGSPTLLSEWFERPTNAIEHFQNELQTYKSKKKIVWQSVLIALNQVIEEIWHELNESDKWIFIQFYKSRWMAYRVGIPVQNARKIYNLFISNQLSLIKNFNKLAYENGKFLVDTNANRFEFDYIIDATGNSEEINLIDSLLLTNMLGQGLIKPHRYGGLEVDFLSSRVINTDNSVESNLFTIGNLTSGTYFFTSVLELNIRHSFKVAQIISSDFVAHEQIDMPVSDMNCHYKSNQLHQDLALS